jgi:hypothetical protein
MKSFMEQMSERPPIPGGAIAGSALAATVGLPTIYVYISTKRMSRSRAAKIYRSLKSDRSVVSVRRIAKGAYIEVKKFGFPQDYTLPVPVAACMLPSYGIGAGFLALLHTLADNKDAIEAMSSITAAASSTVVAIKKLNNHIKTNREKYTRMPIYDEKGNVIKWIKRKKEP